MLSVSGPGELGGGKRIDQSFCGSAMGSCRVNPWGGRVDR
jgi:hypothetical protein